MIEILLFILIGCAIGTFTGLAPGIHINAVSLLALSFSENNDLNTAAMIAAMAVTHSFMDFVPSILLSAPEEETMLSTLPGHYFLLKGKALYAIKLTIAGGIISTIASILLIPFFALFVEKLQGFFMQITPWVLIAAIAAMVLSEKKQKKYAITAMVFSATLGLIALNSPEIQNPLFPLATGFFGAPAIIFSLKKKETIPLQQEKKFSTNSFKLMKTSAVSSIAAAIVSIIPSLGPSQAVFLISQFGKKISRAQYLVVMGGISGASTVFTLAFLFLTGKARTGSAAAIKEIAQTDAQTATVLLGTILVSTGIAAITTDIVSKHSVKKMQKINYQTVNKIVLCLLAILTHIFSGALGLVVFATATAIGLIVLSSGIKRTTAMTFLMVPTILIYLQMAQ